MSIRDWFRSLAHADAHPHADTDTVRRIVGELDQLDPARARYLAAFAYVLSRVAGADLHISDAETEAMVALVRRFGKLPEEQALLVVAIAKNQNRLFGGTENFLVTREFRTVSTESERRELLDCLFAVAAADAGISAEEEAQIWQIASELGFSHADYVAARLPYTAQRTLFSDRSE